MPNQKLFTLDETASVLRVSPHTVRAWVRKGRLLPVRICRRLLFAGSAIDDLIASGSPRQDDQAESTRPAH